MAAVVMGGSAIGCLALLSCAADEWLYGKSTMHNMAGNGTKQRNIPLYVVAAARLSFCIYGRFDSVFNVRPHVSVQVPEIPDCVAKCSEVG